MDDLNHLSFTAGRVTDWAKAEVGVGVVPSPAAVAIAEYARILAEQQAEIKRQGERIDELMRRIDLLLSA